jgi:thioredoxin-like negative regulator of GroEL
MDSILERLVILALVGIATGGAVWMGRRFVAARRRQALAAAPLLASARDATPVRILAFSSEECVQCRRLQMPALRRVLAAHPGAVAVEEIDAPATPALTSRYNILTVPSTVVLDAAGRARAVNYGFTSTDRLLRQVDAVLKYRNATAHQMSAAPAR